VSWYPPGDADDEGYSVDAIVPQLLDAAEKYSLKVCLSSLGLEMPYTICLLSK